MGRGAGRSRASTGLFWVSSLLVAYTWVGYPLLLALLTRLLPRRGSAASGGFPSASIVLVVHNEAPVLADALEDLLALEYRAPLEIIVVSDGSTDATTEIAASYSARGVKLLRLPRVGVTAALAAGVQHALHEVIVRTDADSRHKPDYLLRLLRHYSDESVGVVGGAFKFVNQGDTGITTSEGLYWRFELWLRQRESDLGILSTASSAVLSFRRDLFEPFPPEYGEDVVIPKLAIKQGYRMVQEPSAVAYEVMPQSIGGEFRARRRMVARGIQGLLSREGALNPLRHPAQWAAVISHKLLRWLTPLLLLGSFVSALGLWRRPLYGAAALMHAALYSSALVGFGMERRGRQAKPFSAPFSFCLANAGFLVGLFDAARGRRITAFQSQD